MGGRGSTRARRKEVQTAAGNSSDSRMKPDALMVMKRTIRTTCNELADALAAGSVWHQSGSFFPGIGGLDPSLHP
jgi:hypothetical protein